VKSVKANCVFRHLQHSDKFITIEQGGTRSGKTYNILVWLLFDYCVRNNNKTITVARETFRALRDTVMRDFFDILSTYEVYDPANHNKTTHTYLHDGNIIEFRGLDDQHKVRGAKRHLLFVNEANGVSYPVIEQLLLRTTEKVIIDYNPSDVDSWIYDKFIPRQDSELYVTTYKDNPFLDDRLVKEIERLKIDNPEAWKVFGQGERASVSHAVITRWREDEPPTPDHYVYGIDFGFNAPTAVVRVGIKDDTLIWEECLYERHCTNIDLIEWLESNAKKNDTIYADAAEPARIEEIRRKGFKIKKADKAVAAGLSLVNSYPVIAAGGNLVKELKNYRWKLDAGGRPLDEPVKLNDHAIDAARYATMGLLGKPKGKPRVTIF